MEPKNNNQEREPLEQVAETNRLHKVTPVSKYLAMTLFIILPFLGGWIGYSFAPEKVLEVEKVVEVERVVNNEVETNLNSQNNLQASEVERIIFPNSKNLQLELPIGWEFNNDYILDDQGQLVFTLSYPIREIGYEFADSVNSRTLATAAGFELEVVDRVLREDTSFGFAHYTHFGDDFFEDSFEITVPFRQGLYARTAQENEAEEGLPVRFGSYEEFLSLEGEVNNILSSITFNES